MGPDGQLHETRMGNCALAVVEATAHPPRGGNALADGSHSNTLLPIFVDGIIRIIIIFISIVVTRLCVVDCLAQ